MVEQTLFLSCGLMMVGLILGMVGGFVLYSAAASLRWRSVTGEIIASGVEQREGQPRPSVRYRYTVGDQCYTGARIAFRAPSSLSILSGASTEQAAADTAARYPVGAAAKVYYDPADPARAVLEPGAGGLAAYLPVAAGGLFFVLGLAAAAAALAGMR